VIIDISALLAILYQEEDAEWFVTAMVTASIRRMSAASFLEAAINIDTHGDPEASRQLDHFIRQAAIEIAAVTPEHAQIARQAYLDFGKGRHKAALTFGDCFAYALAKATGEPLLFKGNNFSNTDIVPVRR
jgi:ribonuclease VapC